MCPRKCTLSQDTGGEPTAPVLPQRAVGIIGGSNRFAIAVSGVGLWLNGLDLSDFVSLCRNVSLQVWQVHLGDRTREPSVVCSCSSFLCITPGSACSVHCPAFWQSRISKVISILLLAFHPSLKNCMVESQDVFKEGDNFIWTFNLEGKVGFSPCNANQLLICKLTFTLFV